MCLTCFLHVMKDKKVREEREGEIVSPERILKLSLDFFLRRNAVLIQ